MTTVSRNISDAITTTVVNILARMSDRKPADFSGDPVLVELLSWDSLDILDAAIGLEDVFGPLGDDQFVNNTTTLSQLVALIQVRADPARMEEILAPYQLNTGLVVASPATEQPTATELRIEDFAEARDLSSMLMLFDALGVGNPYFSMLDGPATDVATVNGKTLINFATYNYLGLVGDVRVNSAAQSAITQYGTSASASRIASGDRSVHRELEAGIAAFLGCEDALVYASGHATNVTVLSTLLGRSDLVVHDSLAHDCILAGAQLSGARRIAFPHNDMAALDRILTERRGQARRTLIAVEGVYSMDGDVAPLAELVALKKKHGAMLYVDEAHSLGCIGATGRGIGEHAGVARGDVDVWMGTLSKSLASCGGYIAGSKALIQLLKYKSGGFVYAAAVSPANAAAALSALRILEGQPELVHQLLERANLFRRLCASRGIDTGLSAHTAIVPVIVGASVLCLQVSAALRQAGINAPPIFYPVVEEGAARLRFFISQLHTPEQIGKAVDCLAAALEKFPVFQPVNLGVEKKAPPTPALAAARTIKKVFVTGGSGFIGSRVVRKLVAQGIEVRCLMRTTTPCARLEGISYEVEIGDLHDQAALARGAAHCDAVIHLACASSWSDIRGLGSDIRAVAVDGTRNTMEAARHAGVRCFVHVSSAAAVNGSNEPIEHDEASDYELGSHDLPYSLAKHDAERLVLQAKAEDFEVIVVSPTEVYGPHDTGYVTAGNIADIIDASPAVACHGGVSVVHVDDVADGIVAGLLHGRSGERYILGGENLTIHALTEKVLGLAGRRTSVLTIPNDAAVRLCLAMADAGLQPPIALDVLDYATLYWFMDSSKAMRELGFAPRDADQTLASVVEWLRSAREQTAPVSQNDASTEQQREMAVL